MTRDIDWEYRRKVGLTCLSWTEYSEKLGLRMWGGKQSNDRKHGVRIICFFCRTKPAEDSAYYGLVRRSFCVECIDKYKSKLHQAGDFKHDSLDSKIRTLQMSNSVTPEAIACTISHHAEKEGLKLLKEASEIEAEIHQIEKSTFYDYDKITAMWTQIENKKKEAKALLDSCNDSENSIIIPEFIEKIMNYKEE